MERAIIKIHGIVQGVGFRPFIHRLVRQLPLCGWISNSSSGVELELQGERQALDAFLTRLPREAPALALIERVDVRYTRELMPYTGFEIRQSLTEPLRDTLISPDVALCPDCERELKDPSDRRFGYPFINCTNCGPRFTIIRDVPYDRARTSMSGFPMCPDCDREYRDIRNRRYHAQPDCCPVCGPRLFYCDGSGRALPGDALARAQALLQSGQILAVKGLGGMHLACLAGDEGAVRRLRRRKQRDERPLAVMCRDMAAVRALCEVSPEEEALLSGPRKPIVLLKRKGEALSHLSENRYLGVMLPYTPLHVLLFGEVFDTLVMTSANLSDTPILTDNREALDALRDVADGFLLHNRPIQTRCDDSLCWVLDGEEYFVRRSRGYVPFPVRIPEGSLPILACGAEQKASFCLSRGGHAFPSQHIGDLKNAETLAHYSEQIAHFERLFDIHPALLVCDKHPDYLSTAYALSRGEREGLPVLQVQHHHAHMAACMADNGLRSPVIALTWDGTGFGDDGTIWGGECLVGDYRAYSRFASIRPIPLIGGDRAVKELDRVAFALLREAGCEVSGMENAAFYARMLDASLNCPLSSGMGRLFDGVAAILDLCHSANYEGQGAVRLEAAATQTRERYPFTLAGAPLRFDWREMIRAMMADRAAKVPTGEMAGRFLNTLVAMAVQSCLAAREQFAIHDVALSGGTFQNRILMDKLTRALEQAGFTVWRHRRVSTNDEGLSLGQLMIARARSEGKETNDVSGGTAETD